MCCNIVFVSAYAFTQVNLSQAAKSSGESQSLFILLLNCKQLLKNTVLYGVNKEEPLPVSERYTLHYTAIIILLRGRGFLHNNMNY